MKTIIFYRSSYKGNTFKVAQSIAEVLSAELVSIDTNPEKDLSKYDLIGFGAAINFAAHDIQLQQFVAKQNLSGKKVFLFSTRCRPLLGFYHSPLKKIIKSKGGSIIGEFSCRGYDRTGPWVVVNGYNKNHPNEADLFRSRLFADKIRRKAHPLAAINKSRVIEYLKGVSLRQIGKDRIVGKKVVFLNTSTCVHCGRCLNVCPMHIFTYSEIILPYDESNCIQCQLCADNCPSSSIFIRESFLNGIRIALRESFSDELQNAYQSNNSIKEE